MRWLWIGVAIVVGCWLGLACGLLTSGAAGVTGGAIGGSPAAQEKAAAVDRALVEWLVSLVSLFGGYVGGRAIEAGAKKGIAVRRARKAKTKLAGP